jgi:hypothetical protein
MEEFAQQYGEEKAAREKSVRAIVSYKVCETDTRTALELLALWISRRPLMQMPIQYRLQSLDHMTEYFICETTV